MRYFKVAVLSSAALLLMLFILSLMLIVSPAAASPTPTATVVPSTATPTAVPTNTPTPTPTGTVAVAVIAHSPYGISFVADQDGPNPAHRLLNIWNSGEGFLDWSLVAYTAGWLNMNPVEGGISEGIDSVTVWVDIYGLTPGMYQGIIYIYSSTAVNSPQVVDVMLTVRQAGATPVPTVTPTPTATLNVTATPTVTPTIVPPDADGATPGWVWPVIGSLVGLCAVLAGLALAASGLLGKMFRKGGGGEDALPYEDLYEGEYSDTPQGDADYDDEEL